MNQMDKSYLNVLRVCLNPITFSISLPPDKSLIPLFIGLSTQEFPYKENTIQNYTNVEEVKEHNQIRYPRWRKDHWEKDEGEEPSNNPVGKHP